MDDVAPKTSRAVVLTARPADQPRPEHFRLESRTPEAPKHDQVLCKNLLFSIDPFIRARLNDRPSYAEPVQIGRVLPGLTVSRVVSSNSAVFRAGDIVVGMGGVRAFVNYARHLGRIT